MPGQEKEIILSKAIVSFLIVLYIIFQHTLCFSDSSFDLSGKYKNYNVVLIIADSLRPDYLGCYGYAKNVSPNIDALAFKGVVFTNAFCQMPLTLPSVVSIFTSLYPKSHATIHIFKDSVPENVYTLAEILRIYGYQTAWFGLLQDPHTGAGKGVLRGFNTYRANANFIKEKKRIVNVNFDNIFQWLRQQNKRPIFLVVHTYMPHISYFPFFDFQNVFSKKITDAYKQWKDSAAGLSEKEAYLETGEHKENFLGGSEKRTQLNFKFHRLFKERFKQRVLGLDSTMFNEFLLYLDSSIFEMDRLLVGRLVKELQRNDLAKDTIIIITADHGDEHREHGQLGHGVWLYDESIHVPLIFYIPGFDQGGKIDAFAQSIDILPTTLDLLGIPAPYQAQGMSLLGLIEGKEDSFGRQHVFSQSVDGKNMVRTREWKFIDNSIYAIQDELYNFKKDPQEQDNRISKNTEIAENLKKRFLEWEKSLPSYTDNTKQQFVPYVDKETQERIKKSGYW
jgi:choline-sulfatase